MGTARERVRRFLCAAVTAGLVAALGPVAAAPAQPAAAGTTAQTGPAPSPGCGTSQEGPVVEQQRFVDVGGAQRWFLVTVPGEHDGATPLPIVIDFHGLSEGAQIHTLMSEFSPIAEREGFVVVFPQGRFDPVRWDASPTSTPNQDIDFVTLILDTLGEDLCLDQRRVYAAGLSYGAFMTSLVTCKLSDRFAAVAPVAGLRLLNPCPQTRAVPIVTFHGTLDTFVPYGPTPDIVAGWAARNGCDVTPIDNAVSAEVTRRVFDCPTDADVELFTVAGGGHAWPGSAFSQAIASYVGYTTFDIDASEEAWSFFQRFQLPCPAGADCTGSDTTRVAIECDRVAGTGKAKPALVNTSQSTSVAFTSTHPGSCTGPLAATTGPLTALKAKVLGEASCAGPTVSSLRPLSGRLKLVWTASNAQGRRLSSAAFVRVGRDPSTSDALRIDGGLVVKGVAVGQDISGEFLYQPVQKNLAAASTIDSAGNVVAGAGSLALSTSCLSGQGSVSTFVLGTDGTSLSGAPFDGAIMVSLPV